MVQMPHHYSEAEFFWYDFRTSCYIYFATIDDLMVHDPSAAGAGHFLSKLFDGAGLVPASQPWQPIQYRKIWFVLFWKT
jgi:hypothetical protein